MPVALESAWERRATETVKAYHAFCCYRDLGYKRTLDKAFLKYTNRTHGEATGQWTDWAHRHDWRLRAEAYDLHLERAARIEREQAHQKEIEGFRTRQKQLAQANLASATALLQLGQKRLQAFLIECTPQPGLTPEETQANQEKAAFALAQMDVKMLPSLFRAAAAVADAATNAEAMAISVGDILSTLDAEADDTG